MARNIPLNDQGLFQKVLSAAANPSFKGAPKAAYAPRKPLHELEAFITLDSCLAALHRDFLNAKQERQHCLDHFGADDPMAELAMDVEDAAWCSVQTRYMELRADRALMRKAQDILEQDRKELDSLEAYKARVLAFMRFILSLRLEHEATKKRQDDMALFLLVAAAYWRDGFGGFNTPMPAAFNRQAA